MNLRDELDALEKELILAKLYEHKGCCKWVAEDLGLSRPALYDRLRKHGIEQERYRP